MPYGGGDAEDIMAAFGIPPETYFRRLRNLLADPAQSVDLDTRTVDALLTYAVVASNTAQHQSAARGSGNDQHTRSVHRHEIGAVHLTHSSGTGHSPRSGDRKMNAPGGKPTSLTASGTVPDSSDHAQAQVFAAMLAAEIDTVSALVDEAEHLAHRAGQVGQGTARLWHNEEARSQRKILYELHRQLDALHARFPYVPG